MFFPSSVIESWLDNNMESGTSTDYTYSATTDAKTESNVKEPKAPEGTLLRQVQDAKESISVLKNQVSFADQCLSLLHNQMKHASDTLAILQDQVELAQKTVNSLSLGTAAGLTIQNPQATVAPALSTASRSHPSWINPQSGESDEQRVFVHDCEGPKVYTLSKSSISLGNPAVSECSASHDHGQVPCVVQPRTSDTAMWASLIVAALWCTTAWIKQLSGFASWP